MSIQQLSDLLKQEFARNKAKTLVLLAIFVVAVCMWAPRLMRLTGLAARPNADDNSTDETTEDTEEKQRTGQERAKESASTLVALRRWDQLADMRESDPLMHTVALLNTRNPFLRTEVRAEQLRRDEALAATPLAEPPAPLANEAIERLAVTNTIVGGRGSWVTINGKLYGANEVVTVEGDTPDSIAEFRIEEIRANLVTLIHDGQRLHISLDKDWNAMRESVTVRRSTSR